MQTKIRGIQIGTTDEQDFVASRDGELRVAQYLPKYAQLTAAGKVFGWTMAAGVAKAPYTAMPTTTGTWAVYNANVGGGPHLVILRVMCASVSGTLGLGLALVGTTCIGAQTAVVANYASSIMSCLDGSADQPSAYVSNAVTLIGTQSAWLTLAAHDQVAAVSVGTGLVAEVDGLFIVPPKHSFAFGVLGAAGTSDLFDVNIIFAEVQLDV